MSTYLRIVCSSVGDVVYTLKVTNIFPTVGSQLGGTAVTITGEGFSTTPGDNSVTIGTHNCVITSATVTQLVCSLAVTGTTHEITNQGVDPSKYEMMSRGITFG